MNIDEFIKRLKNTMDLGLPGELAHIPMSPLNRPLTSLGLKEAENVRKSAVGVNLYATLNGIECILIQRPEYDGMHGGQMAFPGGKMDPEDVDLEYTARRECYEEIAIPMSQGETIGQLTKVYIPVSGFVVQPYVFYHDQVPSLIPDPREVAEIISFPIHDLLLPEKATTTIITFPNGIVKEVPCFNLENKNVWGATALMLNEFKEILKKMES